MQNNWERNPTNDKIQVRKCTKIKYKYIER